MTLYQTHITNFNLCKNVNGSGMAQKKALSHKYFHLIADDDNIEKLLDLSSAGYSFIIIINNIKSTLCLKKSLKGMGLSFISIMRSNLKSDSNCIQHRCITWVVIWASNFSIGKFPTVNFDNNVELQLILRSSQCNGSTHGNIVSPNIQRPHLYFWSYSIF